MNKQQNQKHYVVTVSDTTVGGAQLGFVELSVILHSAIEGIRSVEDGIQIQVSNFFLTLRLYADNEFMIFPVVVQSSAGLTDTGNLSNRTVSSLINDSINDVFGYHVLGSKFIVSKRMRGSTAAIQQGIEVTIPLPPKILQILNKETESERLQELYFGFVGVNLSDQTIDYNCYEEIVYTERRKQLTVR